MKTDLPKAFKPKRGRPSAEQVAAIEKAILLSARKMFMSGGYDAVAMERVAAEVGVAKGTLYARYPAKEALFQAVVYDCLAEWSAVDKARDHYQSDDITERLHYHALTIARSMFNPEVRAFQKLLLTMGERFPEISKAMYDAGYLYIVRLLVEDIERAGERDAVGVKDADGVARHLVSVITGWYLQESSCREVTLSELEDFAGRAVGLLLAARLAW
ncbi:MAG: TetR/AcrR family transcriptional regulator [Spongiibacteraceae bacterium]|nr:TetR/AcrR family transcriptional regulator [Spongiibacteraceae bacterium]